MAGRCGGEGKGGRSGVGETWVRGKRRGEDGGVGGKHQLER